MKNKRKKKGIADFMEDEKEAKAFIEENKDIKPQQEGKKVKKSVGFDIS